MRVHLMSMPIFGFFCSFVLFGICFLLVFDQLRIIIPKLCRHLKTYLYSLAYPPRPTGVSLHLFHLLTTGKFIDFDIDPSFCIDASLHGFQGF